MPHVWLCARGSTARAYTILESVRRTQANSREDEAFRRSADSQALVMSVSIAKHDWDNGIGNVCLAQTSKLSYNDRKRIVITNQAAKPPAPEPIPTLQRWSVPTKETEEACNLGNDDTCKEKLQENREI